MLKSEVISFFTNHYVDLLINVSSSEGLPVSMMEAMSARIPVMGTRVGGVNEIVKDGYNGFLLPPDPDAGFIANSLRKFYLLPEAEKEKFRLHAFNTWEEKFNAAINYPSFTNEILSL
jgi:glycosyltransferase involved in cell wall biosynthesis